MHTTENSPLTTTQGFIQEGIESGLFSGAAIGFLSQENTVTGYSGIVPHSNTPWSKDILYDIGSLTKTIVGTIILKMLDDGRITLDTPLYKFVGGTEETWKKITVYHLLTNSFKLGFQTELYKHTPEEVEMILTSSPVTKINDWWYYHNHNSILLGWLIENFFKQPLNKIVADEILEPAGMKNTYWFNEIPEDQKKFLLPVSNPRIEAGQAFTGLPHDELAYMYAQHNQRVGCAGLFSTLPDILTFCNYITKEAFGRPHSMFRMMLKNHLEHCGRTSGLVFDKPKEHYLCNCFARDTLVSTSFTGCALWIQPEAQKSLVILTNITYPIKPGIRPVDKDGFPMSPLFDWRRRVVAAHFGCIQCPF